MTDKAFLGVERSVLGFFWSLRCTEAQQRQALAMTQQYGLPDILSQVLVGRDVALDDVESFLEPKLRDLMPDPSVLKEMEKAVSRLVSAIEKKETVAIFGDYDVDGACSAALMAHFLQLCGLQTRIHIPDRITEGYGPNSVAIRALQQEGAQLLITVDCGTASIEPLETAKSIGLDVLVFDHHQAPEILPEAVALINPNRQDDLSGLGYLCAAGVVFFVLVALNRELRKCGFWKKNKEPEPNLLEQLDLVALATVADVSPLIALNRAFVRQGLSVMKKRGRRGLSALMDAARFTGAPEAWHLGFLLGPRINAGGRIGDATLGAQLLLCDDPIKASSLAEELDQLNRDRQAIEQVCVLEAEGQADVLLEKNPDQVILTVHSPGWHPGVVGLVASRLKERFRRPVFAFAMNDDGTATGSGRSIPGVDLGKLVRKAVDQQFAQKGGGHSMAAGVTLQADSIEAFSMFLNSVLGSGVRDEQVDKLLIDGTLSALGAQPSLLKSLEKAGPFGSSQPEPVFAFTNHRLVEAREVGAGGHVRVKFASGDGQSIGGIAFRAAQSDLGRALAQNIGRAMHVVGTLSANNWGGKERVDLRLMDISVCE